VAVARPPERNSLYVTDVMVPEAQCPVPQPMSTSTAMRLICGVVILKCYDSVLGLRSVSISMRISLVYVTDKWWPLWVVIE
jgi:hypothetical protein